MSGPSRLALVTGAAGFVGSHVAQGLAGAGWRVIGAGHGTLVPARQHALGLTDWRSGDLSAAGIEALIAQHGAPELVVHAAGGASVRAAEENPNEDYRRTVLGTTALLEALKRRAPGACLVLPSSAAIYGNDHAAPICEDSVPAPISVYGRHKLRTEELCLEAAEECGMPLVLVRFFSLYGAGLRKQIFWDLRNKILGGGRIVLSGTGDESRDFLHAADAARLMLEAAGHARSRQPLIVNGGTGIATTIRDAALLMERLCACQAEIVFNGEVRKGDPAHLIADTTRLDRIGFAPRISFKDGLADYAAWATRTEQDEARDRLLAARGR